MSEHNGFDHLAQKWKALMNAVMGQEGMPPMLPILSADDRARSAPKAQGWDGERHRLLEEVPEVVMRPIRCLTPVQEPSTNQPVLYLAPHTPGGLQGALYTPPPIPTGLLLDSRTPTGFY